MHHSYLQGAKYKIQPKYGKSLRNFRTFHRFGARVLCNLMESHAISYVSELIISLFNKSTANDLGEFIAKRYYVIPSLIVLFLISFVDSNIYEFGTFPEEWKLSIRQPIANGVKALTVHPGFIGFTKGLRAFVYLNLLHPLDVFLTHIPWWFTMSIFVTIGYFTVGLRFAFITALLLLLLGLVEFGHSQ